MRNEEELLAEEMENQLIANYDFEHDDEKYCIDDIVWWKEIVLPKEMKEND